MIVLSDIGVEVVFFRRVTEKQLELISVHEMTLEHGKSKPRYACHIALGTAGVFEYGFRIFPKHPLLAHRQDFGLVRWL